MPNERITENIVRELLRKQGYLSKDIVIEEQSSKNPKINKLLKTASKSGLGQGYPEFIITFKNKPDNLIVIECKAETKFHKSEGYKKPKEYAVDGVLLYASYLKDDFNVMAIAVSGETEREVKISHFLWLKNNYTFKDVTDKTLLDPDSIFCVIDKQSQPLKEEELIKKAIEYNNLLHGYSIPEIDRCTIISSILVALQDKVFANSYNEYFSDDESSSEYNPNDELIKGLLAACGRVLERNKISGDKQEIIIREYEKLKSNHTLRNKMISINRKTEVKNTVLRDLIKNVMENIMPYIDSNIFDVLGKFYTQFIRYAGSDSKTGLVLTPTHITEFFCDLVDVTEKDIIYDPCCGTGGFLVAAMGRMLEQSGSNLTRHKSIKSRQLIGVEKRPDMFSHACSNMMMRGDGKSHIYFGDCFDSKLKDAVVSEHPTKTFLNPPYDVGPDGQLEFVENAADTLQADGFCVAICQMSTCTDTKKKTIEVRERLLNKHTLEAVLSMPDDLFYPVGVITSILIFKAHTPHPKGKKTFFGYFKDDGFLKVKNKGRLDSKGKWTEISSKWLNIYKNKENLAGLSVMHEVRAKDEWCAEAYMKTDYSKLSQADFEEVVKQYVIYKLLNGIEV